MTKLIIVCVLAIIGYTTNSGIDAAKESFQAYSKGSTLRAAGI